MPAGRHLDLSLIVRVQHSSTAFCSLHLAHSCARFTTKMGGSEPPYLYDRPQHTRNSVAYPYSHFNPKAVSEASYAAVSTATLPRPQHNGPLINFNQHPDSYMIVTGQNVDFQPMSANTKKTVTILRWVQFALRVLEELGALGLLVATICIRGTQGAVTYLLRIPVCSLSRHANTHH